MRGVAGSDYVNASFISGYRNLYDFIAYQTPYINDQVDDVWRTVWSHNIGVIVLLNKEGCSDFQQYWPDGRPARYLYFVVEVWGVGSKTANKLKLIGVNSVLDLKELQYNF